MQKFAVINKHIGETPLSAMEAWREKNSIDTTVPLTYAGRLDPLASGALLVLVGEECKQKDSYLALDKAYEFTVLFGVASDTHDVMGRLTPSDPVLFDERVITHELDALTGTIELPYPHFSSKTVHGKPLHTWAVEDRLDEIDIPTKESVIYSLLLIKTVAKSREDVYNDALEKINSIPPVTELRKALGNDFRRDDIREDWDTFLSEGAASDLFYTATISCVCSSGTYMRSLANVLGARLGTGALASSITRTKIGKYKKIPLIGGIWTKQYTETD